jgi:hypothetical protein
MITLVLTITIPLAVGVIYQKVLLVASREVI